jgi:hypothetical protein
MFFHLLSAGRADKSMSSDSIFLKPEAFQPPFAGFPGHPFHITLAAAAK